MSTLTAQGRKQLYDYRRSRMNRELRQDASLTGVPAHHRNTLSELKLIGRDLYANIRQRGVMLPDASVNPAVEAHRKNAHQQLCFFLNAVRVEARAGKRGD